MYSNPVIDSDFPDLNCIRAEDTYYVFATNPSGMQSHIQVATSRDLVHYQLLPDALPNLPRWAKPGRTWAPNVTHIQNSKGSTYVLYFVAWDIETDRQAIGLATSKNPEGPYQSTDSKPLIAQVNALLTLTECLPAQTCVRGATSQQQPHQRLCNTMTPPVSPPPPNTLGPAAAQQLIVAANTMAVETTPYCC